MGRSLKTAQLNKGLRQLIDAVSRHQKDPLPQKSETLRRALDCIVTNIGARNQHEGKVMRAMLQYLAGLEELKFRGIEKIKNLWLQDLGKSFLREGGTHSRVTISLQNQMTIEYFKKEAFPDKALSIATQQVWFYKQGPVLFEKLIGLPCFCLYQPTFDESDWPTVKGYLDRKGRVQLTTRQAILLLLAHLHNSRPDEIAKLIAESPWP